jgi:hypothetical protein
LPKIGPQLVHDQPILLLSIKMLVQSYVENKSRILLYLLCVFFLCSTEVWSRLLGMINGPGQRVNVNMTK